MKDKLYLYTKTVAYFLWEYTGHDNAMALWRCAEDAAFFAERHDFVSLDKIQSLIIRGKYSYAYMDFVRNIAYRIYLYTGVNDSKKNWFIAERVIYNSECCAALAGISGIFRAIRNKEMEAGIIHSDLVRRYYK